MSAGNARRLVPLLAEVARRNDASLAIADPCSNLSYAQLWAASGRALKGILALDVQPGDGVACWSPNVAETLVVQLAALRAGAITVHLDPEWEAENAAAALQELGTHCLFVRAFFQGRQYPAMIKSVRERLPHLKAVIVHGREPRFERILRGGWSEFLEFGDGVSDAAARQREKQVGEFPVSRPVLRFCSVAGGARPPVQRGKASELSEGQLLELAAPRDDAAPLRTCVGLPLHQPAALVGGCFRTLLGGGTVLLSQNADALPEEALLGNASNPVTTPSTAAEFRGRAAEHPTARPALGRCRVDDSDGLGTPPPKAGGMPVDAARFAAPRQAPAGQRSAPPEQPARLKPNRP